MKSLMEAERDELSSASQGWRREANPLKSEQNRFNSNVTKSHQQDVKSIVKRKTDEKAGRM